MIDIDFQIEVANNSDIFTIVHNNIFWDWCFPDNNNNLIPGIFYDCENNILKDDSNRNINKILNLKYKGNFFWND